MELLEITGGLLVGVVVLLVLRFLISLPFKIIWNSLVGAIMLYLFNLLGIFTIKITFIHSLIAGIFGIPGVIGLAIYLHFFK